jgi:tetratricopeptide (TPR) repeat protein
MSHLASALLIQPDFPNALDGLAWILATSENPAFRNGTEAVGMAERACALTNRKDAQKLRTLAAAYAEAGRFPEAISTIQSAMEREADSSKSSASEAMLRAFKSSQPWRDPEIK